LQDVKREVMFVAKDAKESAWIGCCASDIISQNNIGNDEALCQVSRVLKLIT